MVWHVSYLGALALAGAVFFVSTSAQGGARTTASDTAVEIGADVDADGYVDFLDLGVLIADFGAPPFNEPRADVNGDGVVNVLDLALIGRDFGKLASQPLAAMRIERAFPDLSFERLTNLVQPDDGRNHLFVTEQMGRILAFPND